MVLDAIQAIDFIRQNQSVPKWIMAGRTMKTDLEALVNGKGFHEMLIHAIEHLESSERTIARRKYSRNIVDFYERLFLPIDNVYSAAGGSKHFEQIQSKVVLKSFLQAISNIRDNKSLSKWLEINWMKRYHTDPNGVIFKEYSTTDDNTSCWPTYKGIHAIRTYKSAGHSLEVILFEPIDYKKTEESDPVKVWRLVDDITDWRIRQDGETYTIITSEQDFPFTTFEHPFGKVPGIVNSDIMDIDENVRISPLFPIIALSKEYASDQSFLSIYKPQKGSPKHWRYRAACQTCKGAKKIGETECKSCDGKGWQKSSDVTDMITLQTPNTKDSPDITPPFGYVSPDIETVDMFVSEQTRLNDISHRTMWGVADVSIPQKTATGVMMDLQPQINKLNKYSSTAEWVEWFFSDLTLKFIDPISDADISINLGRDYILQSAEMITDRYHKQKDAGDNITILDRTFNELLTAKHQNDPQTLRVALIKAGVEPYLHYTLKEVNELFDVVEAQKKVLFRDFWEEVDKANLDKDKVKSEFNTWVTKELTKFVPKPEPIV